MQFSLEDARERLSSLAPHPAPHPAPHSPDRRGTRLDPANVREQRHSVHLLHSAGK